MKNDIVMISGQHQILEIVKPTKARFFQDIEKGDVLQFSMIMQGAGRSKRGLYASYIKTVNLTQQTWNKNSLNDLDNRLGNFELGEAQ